MPNPQNHHLDFEKKTQAINKLIQIIKVSFVEQVLSISAVSFPNRYFNMNHLVPMFFNFPATRIYKAKKIALH